jgi:hypothetical protein
MEGAEQSAVAEAGTDLGPAGEQHILVEAAKGASAEHGGHGLHFVGNGSVGRSQVIVATAGVDHY